MRVCASLFGALALIIGVLAGTGFGQEVGVKNDPSYPLQILSVTPEFRDGGKTMYGPTLSIQNVGNVPCVAFAASVVVKFSDGQSEWIGVSEDRASVRYEPAKAIAAGQTYESVSRGWTELPQGVTATGMEARIDYIEMADGKTYGADPQHKKFEFGKMRMIRGAERKRLLGIYQQKGLDALLNELQRQ